MGMIGLHPTLYVLLLTHLCPCMVANDWSHIPTRPHPTRSANRTRTRDRRRDELAHHAAIEVDERVRGRKQVREMQQTQQHARVLAEWRRAAVISSS